MCPQPGLLCKSWPQLVRLINVSFLPIFYLLLVYCTKNIKNKLYFTKKFSRAPWWSSWCLKFQLFRKQICWCGWNSNYEGLYGANSELIWPDITLCLTNAAHCFFYYSYCLQLTCLGRKCGNIWWWVRLCEKITELQ